jgi:predicted transcriptional regulator
MRKNQVRFVLDKTINDMGITGNRVAVEAKIRSNTIYDILANNKKTISLEHLTAIRDALNQIAAEEGISSRYDITDIIR